MGQRQCPYQEDKLCLLNGLWSQGLSLSLSHGGLQLLKPSRAVPNNARSRVKIRVKISATAVVRFRSSRESKAAKRLGDFLQTERGLRLCQS